MRAVRHPPLAPCALGALLVSCAPAPPVADDQRPDAPGPAEVFPGVRVDRAARTVEFDGVVPIDVRNPDGTPIFLEVVVCTADTREHESLVATTARPSDIHAALLLIGLEPGRPGGFRRLDAAPGERPGTPTRFERIPPEGDGVRVDFVVDRDGSASVEPASSWVVRDRTLEPLPDDGFVFAGSRFVTRQGREWYDADGAGTLIGLHTFGSECVAWRGVMSPESAVDEPAWVAHPSRTPPFGAPVIVRLSPGR